MAKKIIFLTEEIIKAGGVVRVVNIWSNYFAGKNDFVTIVANNIDKPFYEFNKNIQLIKWDFEFNRKIIGLPYNVYQIYKLLNKFRKQQKINFIIDRAIHIEPIWMFRKLGLFKNINLIYFVHGGSSDFRDFYMSRPLVRHRVKMIFDAFDKVICLYDDEINYPKEVKKEKLHFIPNPLPFEPSNIELSQKENVILYLGRVTKAKGIDTLIYAWDKIKNDVNDWKLQIVGDGEDKEEFINLVKKLNIQNIEFLSSTNKVKKIYEKAKIFVLPSIAEGMPMAILEAMACKCCVISSKTAGGKKLVQDNKNGLLFNIGNKEELSNKIINLIKNRKIRESLAINAFKEIEQYKIENIFKEWNKVLV